MPYNSSKRSRLISKRRKIANARKRKQTEGEARRKRKN